MFFNQECKYFLSNRPCKFHKLNLNLTCEKCNKFSKKSKKILIIKLAALGDVVRTTSILKPLYNKYNSPEIYWLTYPEAVSILENNPYIKEIIVYSDGWQLLAEKFDFVINLDLDVEALRLSKLISAEKKLGFYFDENNKVVCSNLWAEKWFSLSHNDKLKKQNKLTYQECILKICEIDGVKSNGYPIIINLSEEEKKFAQEFKLKKGIDKNDFVIGINTGGGEKWPKKEWPVENTVELIKMLVNQEKVIIKKSRKYKKVKILIFGGKKEKERNRKIFSLLNFANSKSVVIDTGTNNSLREFCSLLNLCNVVVCTDTLALHLCLGLNKKVVALFGPTSYNEIELYGLGKKVVSPMDCIVCYDRSCKKSPYCMNLISPKKVFSETVKLSQSSIK